MPFPIKDLINIGTLYSYKEEITKNFTLEDSLEAIINCIDYIH
jgi:hypothetical protein